MITPAGTRMMTVPVTSVGTASVRWAGECLWQTPVAELALIRSTRAGFLEDLDVFRLV